MTIIFIAGESRSGTTILEKTLSGSQSLVSLGETRYLLQRGLIGGEHCGCGTPLTKCEFWSEVMREAFGSPHYNDLLHWRHCQQSVDSPAKFIASRTSLRGLPTELTRNQQEYIDFVSQLYISIQKISKQAVLLESSKAPSTAHVWRRVVGPDKFAMLHVTRHPCAVAFSLTRKKEWGPSGSGGAMSTYPWYRASLRWTLVNRVLRTVDFGARRCNLKYEDFVQNPKIAITQVAEALNVDIDTEHIQDKNVDMQPVHSVSGNPSRFSTGRVTIREDEEWKNKLPRHIRRGVELLTCMERSAYGY